MKAYSTLLIILAASSPFLWVPNAGADDLRAGNRQYVREANGLFVRDRIGDEWEVAPGTVLVRFSSSASTEQINACADSHRLMWKRHRANATGYFLFQYEPDRDPLSVVNELMNEPIVIDACPDTKIKLWGTNDHYYSRQWNLRKTRMDRAWEITTGGSSLIAIIDLGIDYNHEDLRSGMWKNTNDMPGGGDNDADSSWYGQPMVDDTTGWDFVDDDNDPRPANSGDYHGTTVAGVVSATRNNSIGIAGVLGAEATDGSKFMTLRTARDSASQVAPAIEYAWRKGATVINMSFGLWSDSSNAVATQIDIATAHGVILVAAVGNGGEQGYPSSHVTFPATHTSVIAWAPPTRVMFAGHTAVGVRS
jgi:subtilisin family serine protease